MQRAAVRQGHRDDLPIEEAIVTGAHREVLTLDRVAVHLLTGDPLAICHVFGGLTHGDVDIGILLHVAGKQARILCVRWVRVAMRVARDALDADRDEGVALSGLDRVVGHAARLQ